MIFDGLILYIILHLSGLDQHLTNSYSLLFFVFFVTSLRGQSRSGVHCCHTGRLPIGLAVSANHEAASGGLQVKVLLTGKRDKLEGPRSDPI